MLSMFTWAPGLVRKGTILSKKHKLALISRAVKLRYEKQLALETPESLEQAY